MFRSSLEKIVTKCDGVVAVSLMGFDSIPVQNVLAKANPDDRDPISGDDFQTITAEFTSVLAQIRSTAKVLESGALDEVIVRCDRLTYAVRVLNEDYFLGAVLTPHANLGHARFLMRISGAECRQEL